MANLLHLKGSRTQILKTLPSNTTGNDGDIILSTIQGRGVYLCSKVNGRWYVADKLQELRKIENTSIKDLKVNRLKTGNTTLTPNEYDVSVGNLTLDVAGQIELNADTNGVYFKDDTVTQAWLTKNPDGNAFYIYDDATTSDFMLTQVKANGETVISTVDNDGAVGHLTLDPDGELNLTPVTEVKSDAPLKIKEASNAVADTAAYGQLWVKTATPNQLYFTTDAGDDIQLTSGTATAFVGDITGVTAGDGLTGGGTSGAVSLAVGVDDSTIEIDSDALRVKDDGITYAKIQNVTATDRILGRDSSGAGVIEEITPANLRTMINVADGATAVTNHVTNDAADIMAVSDFGANAALKIDADQPATAGAEDSVGLWIDYDRIVAGSGTAAHNDIGINLDVNSASLGTSSVVGMDIDVVGATSGTHTATGISLDVDGADTNIGMIINTAGTHLKLEANADVNDYATFTLADTGDLTIATVGSGTTDSDLTLDADGDILMDAAGGDITITSADVSIAATKKLYLDGGGDTFIYENAADSVLFKVGNINALIIKNDGDNGAYSWFRNTCIGFDRNEATFSTTGIIGSGGTDDTDIDFRFSNKFRLEMTGDITTINLIFPPVAGNFLLVCTTDGDHDVSNWKVWEYDESAATTTDVMWAGGSVPAFTSSGVDIVSFYWDNSEQQCYGVASLAFATP